jgi:hypothetical protein
MTLIMMMTTPVRRLVPRLLLVMPFVFLSYNANISFPPYTLRETELTGVLETD